MAKKEQKFMLVSLEEDKAKKLAQVISNETCRKILDHLTGKEATETELSKELNLPISTVHYNLKQLAESGLVLADEYHYSKKGREVMHYSLANKYIIIAPKTADKVPSFRNILPVTLIIAGSVAFLKLFSDYLNPVMEEKASAVMPLAVERGADAIAPVQQSSFITWFVAGAIFALLVYVAYDFISLKIKR